MTYLINPRAAIKLPLSFSSPGIPPPFGACLLAARVTRHPPPSLLLPLLPPLLLLLLLQRSTARPRASPPFRPHHHDESPRTFCESNLPPLLCTLCRARKLATAEPSEGAVDSASSAQEYMAIVQSLRMVELGGWTKPAAAEGKQARLRSGKLNPQQQAKQSRCVSHTQTASESFVELHFNSIFQHFPLFLIFFLLSSLSSLFAVRDTWHLAEQQQQ